jgi:hypothetical protein
MATPSTVIARLGSAEPSIRSRVPLSSARAMLTVACAAVVATITMATASIVPAIAVLIFEMVNDAAFTMVSPA